MRRTSTFFLAVCLCGCWSAGYDKAYEASLDRYQAEAEFASLHAQPIAFLEEQMQVRVPKVFVKQLDGTESPPHSTPPFVRNFPGFLTAFEASINAVNIQSLALLTLGAVPAAEQTHEDVAATILTQVQEDESFPQVKWEPRDVQSQAGTTEKWNVLELRGPQLFDQIVAGNPESKRSAGVCAIWVSAQPRQSFCTVIACRAPDGISAAVPVAKLAELVARTVEVHPTEKNPAVPPAPKPPARRKPTAE